MYHTVQFRLKTNLELAEGVCWYKNDVQPHTSKTKGLTVNCPQTWCRFFKYLEVQVKEKLDFYSLP